MKITKKYSFGRLTELILLAALPFSSFNASANSLWPESQYPKVNGVQDVGMGYIQEVNWPWIYHHEQHRWLYIEPQSELENIRVYRPAESQWLWTQENLGTAAFNYSSMSWEGVMEESYPVYYYLQSFANDSGAFQRAETYGWSYVFGDQATGGVSNRIHYFIGSDPMENVNAMTPFGDNIGNGTWTGNSTAIQLAYTMLDLTVDQAEAALLMMDINNSQNDYPVKFVIQAGGSWYASADTFEDSSPTWLRCELPVGGDTLWVPVSLSNGVLLRVESGPEMTFSEIDAPVTAVGVYMEPQGTHRFDNFGVILPSHLVDDGGTPVPIPPVTREDMYNSMQRYFGQGPSETVDPEVETLEVVDEEDYRRIHIRYLVDTDEYSYAYIMLPFPLPEEGQRLPMVLALHPTSDLGKNRVAGIYDTPPTSESDRQGRLARQYALDLVRRGFVVFAPDRAAFGERRLLEEGGTTEQMNAYRDFLSARYPGFRLTSGKNVWDLERALDFLVDLPYVDPDNIGTIGHSLGAWDSIMMIGMDERIKAAVVNSGGMVDYREELWTDPDVLKVYLNGTQSLNMNVNIWMMLAAPRSLMYLWSLQDAYEGGGPHIIEGFRTMTEYWEDAGRSQPGFNKADLTMYFHGSGHDFPPEARALAFQYLVERLGDPREILNP